MTGFVPLHVYLRRQLAGGQVSHAYIFSGTGGEAQAEAFAAALLCLHPDADGTACGSCAACRNLLAGSHVDCRWFDPVNHLHRAEGMRELVAAAALSPIVGSRKIFLLREAERITEDGANTLLKLLEEPPPDMVLILLSDQPDALLPTILSRCQLFLFGSGQPEPALPEEILQAAEELLLSLPQLPVYQVLLRARAFEKDREQQKQFFFALFTCLHQAIRGELKLPMQADELMRSANMMESALEMLSANVNAKLLADVVYLRLWQNSSH